MKAHALGPMRALFQQTDKLPPPLGEGWGGGNAPQGELKAHSRCRPTVCRQQARQRRVIAGR